MSFSQISHLKTCPWTEVDNAVQLHNQAWFSLLEAEIAVLDAGAGAQKGPGEAAGPPDARLALQVSPLFVDCGLVWGREEKEGLVRSLM